MHTCIHTCKQAYTTRERERERERERDRERERESLHTFLLQHVLTHKMCTYHFHVLSQQQFLLFSASNDWKNSDSNPQQYCPLPRVFENRQHSLGTWPPSPYRHHSPVGHPVGLCLPSLMPPFNCPLLLANPTASHSLLPPWRTDSAHYAKTALPH